MNVIHVVVSEAKNVAVLPAHELAHGIPDAQQAAGGLPIRNPFPAI